jgi:hypothetical protein
MGFGQLIFIKIANSHQINRNKKMLAMKKIYHLILLCFGVALSFVSLNSCDECKDIDCPQDMKFPDVMELWMPYQVGQVVRFANANGDTISLTCNSREYSEQEIIPSDRIEEDCCSDAFVENLSCNLGGINDYRLRISTVHPGGSFYIIKYFAMLDSVQFVEDNYDGRSQESIELNNKIFHNIYIIDKDPDFILYTNHGLGVVGFKINGEEWALVE